MFKKTEISLFIAIIAPHALFGAAHQERIPEKKLFEIAEGIIVGDKKNHHVNLTPLGKEEIILLNDLFIKGLSVDRNDAMPWQTIKTLLLLASQHRPAAVPLLVEKGANPNKTGDNNISPLMLVSYLPHSNAALKSLIEAKAKIDHNKTELNRTALMLASNGLQQENVHDLLEAHADPNLLDYNGNNALAYAAQGLVKHPEKHAAFKSIKDLLVRAGIKVKNKASLGDYSQSKSGKGTAYDILMKAGLQDAAELLIPPHEEWDDQEEFEKDSIAEKAHLLKKRD